MAKQEASADAGAEAVVAPKKKSRKLLLIIAAIVVLVVAGSAAAVYLRMQKIKAIKNANPEVAVEQKKPAHKDNHPPVFLPLENFTVNLADTGDAHYLQIKMVFEVADLKAGDAVKAYMPVIRSRILVLLSSKSSDQLNTPDGKKKLAQDVLELTRSRLPDVKEDPEKNKGLREVHFDSFVIQ